MKRYFLAFAAITLTLVLSASCHKGGKAEEAEGPQIDSVMTDNPWVSIDPLELEMKPVSAFSQDWMALATGSRKKFNAMTVSWGSVGELWGKHIVTVFVSEDRYSKRLLDENTYFTLTAFPDTRANKEALVYIGSHSQSDEPDKIANSGLTAEFTELGNPIFAEGNLAIECKKLYSDAFVLSKIPQEIRDAMYTEMGVHSFFIGEIVNVWEKK